MTTHLHFNNTHAHTINSSLCKLVLGHMVQVAVVKEGLEWMGVEREGTQCMQATQQQELFTHTQFSLTLNAGTFTQPHLHQIDWYIHSRRTMALWSIHSE